MKNIHLTQG